MQPAEHSPELEMFTTRRVAVVEGDRRAAEMLHTFFRLMELDCTLVAPDFQAVATIRRLAPDVLILDLDLADLRALEIARESRRTRPDLPLIFLTDSTPIMIPIDAPVLPKPHDRFEELLRLLEIVLAFER
ncbi:MAG TPA: response regulator [Thermoanaerobaculia bacterium]|nr:response regulator [Thermoanaerobaculia bacterium]